MKHTWLATLLLLGGCTSSTPMRIGTSPSNVAIAAPAPRDYIHDLAWTAKRDHKYWRIFCTRGDGDHAFQADLCDADCGLYYAEDGGKEWWGAEGATQAAAAQNLLDNWYPEKVFQPDHKNAAPMKHKQCPPELHGGPQ